jgi:valyl-tRNA synthetase
VEYEMDLIESTVKCLRSLRAEVFEDRKNERYTLDFCFVLVASLIMCISSIQVF